MKNIAQKLQERDPDMFNKVMALKDNQFKVQVEAENKLLFELAEKYGLRRELMYIEGRSYLGRENQTYLFYDHKEIGTVTREYRTEGRSHFLDHTFTPNPNAHIICGEINAMKEREEAFGYFSRIQKRKPNS